METLIIPVLSISRGSEGREKQDGLHRVVVRSVKEIWMVDVGRGDCQIDGSFLPTCINTRILSAIH